MHTITRVCTICSSEAKLKEHECKCSLYASRVGFLPLPIARACPRKKFQYLFFKHLEVFSYQILFATRLDMKIRGN